MKVPVLIGANKIEFQERPKPTLSSDEVLVKVAYCGICGTDVRAYHYGTILPVGTVLGHEISGTVAEIGKQVTSFKIGDRVAVKPLAECGECYWCKRGQFTICPKVVEGIGCVPEFDGGFAEYVRIPQPEKMLFKLAENISFESAALAEPLSVSFRPVRLSRFKIADRVLVMGAGMIGLGVLQFLKIGGAKQVIAVDISEEKCRLAREMGADIVLNPKVEGAGMRDKIFSLTDQVGADIVFECAGVKQSFEDAINYVKRGGQFMIVGCDGREASITPLNVVFGETEIKGSFSYTEDDFGAVIGFLEQEKIKTNTLISDVIKLDDVVEKGFNRILTERDLVRVLVKP